jgi:FAD/FMN-containing dehydrogenase
LSVQVTDASGYSGSAERVFTPSSEAEISAILREGLPVTIAGARTGLTGGAVPREGWVIQMDRLNGIEVIAGRAVCGAGAVLRDVQKAAERTGQLYPPDPTEWTASIGGTIATNASGSRSYRFGATRRYVEALRVVQASGEVLSLRRGDKAPFDLPALPRSAATKNTAGYFLQPEMDYIDLFIGSEGTLGVITEAELRLMPEEKDLMSGVIFFDSDEEALDAVDRWRSIPGLRMLEYMDAGSLALLGQRASAALFAMGAADRERFRAFRHALPEAVNDLVRRLGLRKMGSDFAVPVGRNREMLRSYREALDRQFAGKYVIFGHIGDAHLHVNVLPRNEAEWERAKELFNGFARRAVELGGTVSAEHGLGKSKRHLLQIQFSAAEIESMKRVKKLLDPNWLLGRGTLLECLP